MGQLNYNNHWNDLLFFNPKNKVMQSRAHFTLTSLIAIQKAGWRLSTQTQLIGECRWIRQHFHFIFRKQNWLIMKLTAILLLTACLQVSANGFSQNITLSEKNISLQKIFKQIHKQTGYQFFYQDEMLDKAGRINIKVKDVPLEKVLAICFKDLPFTYSIANNTITIKPKKEDKVIQAPPPAFIDIHGVVKNTQGTPLAGVSVIVKGTNRGTSTNSDGSFSIDAKAGDVLEFTIVGYQKKSVVVGTNNNLNIQLEVEALAGSEIVVVGYGTQKKVSLTSAVSTVNGEDLQRRPVSNVQQALQGQVPGLTVLDQGGSPGRSNTVVRVRGITTIGANDPLVIVDGIEQQLSDINPNDIETISLLKDASSTAIYGSRAANGVLLITTKRAKSGKTTVTYTGCYALQQANNRPEHMGLEDYMREQNVAFTNVGSAPKFTEDQIKEYLSSTDRYKYPLPNIWFETMLRTAPQINNSVSISGGNENFKGRVSLRYQEQEGIIANSDSKIYEVRANTDFKVSSKINISTDVNYRYNKDLSFADQFNVFNIMLHASEFTVPRYPDGTYGLSPQGRSPLVENELGGYSRIANDYILGNVKGDWEIAKGLKFTTQFAGSLSMMAGKNFLNSYEIRDYYNPDIVKKSVPLNNLTETRNIAREYTLNNLLNYSTTIKENHDLAVLLGYSQIKNDGNNLSAFRQNFYNNDVQSIGQGVNDATKSNDGNETSWGLRSYFGRINYAFQNKYLFEANARYDGSSRFTENNRYSFFPSFSAGWRLSQENFWGNLNNYINEFKIRGSWGKTGNQAVALYSYYSTLDLLSYSFSGAPVQGYTQLKMSNEDLTWETTTQTDVGLDAQVLDNKFSLSIDYYNKKTDGILLVLPVPGTLGLQASAQNAGVVTNKGWEFLVGAHEKFGQVGFDANLNFNINTNNVVSLEGTGPYITGSDTDPKFITGEGYPINSFWGYLTDGLFQTQDEVDNYPTIAQGIKPGDVKYVDRNSDGKINAEDMTYLGPSFPKYTFGSSFNLAYKGFTLNLLFQGAAKVNTRLSGALAEMGNQEGFTDKIYANNYWTPENPNARFPRPTKYSLLNIQSSDRMLINGAYLRLKNIQLMYQIPSAVLHNTFIEHLGIYVSGTNLLTVSKLNEWNLDPETMPGRANYYPQTALYTFGINAQF
jgi:TonB-linked SusC/RagA family outer membrane protein